MQFSENWLRTLVDTDLDSQALSHALTMAGLEVEDMQPVAASFSNVVVAKIVSAEKHPDAVRQGVHLIYQNQTKNSIDQGHCIEHGIQRDGKNNWWKYLYHQYPNKKQSVGNPRETETRECICSTKGDCQGKEC